MTTDPRPTEISLSPQTPTEFPSPLPIVTTTTYTTPASSHTRPTRTDWGRIAIFGIPYAAFFLVGVPTWIFPASWILVVIVQAATRIALYGGNPPVAENQQQVINALNDGTLGLAFSFFVTVGVPLVEEMFYRHILIGKLSAYAPTWLVASISAALFAYMHSHQWQDFFSYLPLSIVLTLIYVKSGKNVAYSWMFHALNNTIMVALMFTMQGALQNA